MSRHRDGPRSDYTEGLPSQGGLAPNHREQIAPNHREGVAPNHREGVAPDHRERQARRPSGRGWGLNYPFNINWADL